MACPIQKYLCAHLQVVHFCGSAGMPKVVSGVATELVDAHREIFS